MLQRKLEREFVLYGGAPPASGMMPDENDEDNGQDKEREPIPSVTGIPQKL